MLSQEFLEKMKSLDLEDVSQYIRSISTPMLVSMGAVAVATTYYLTTRPKALPPLWDLHTQSVEVPGSDFVHRSALQKEDGYLTHVYEDARTMYESFIRGARVSNNGPCLGFRKPKQPYEWMSYKEVMKRAENLGSAFLHKGHSKTTNPHIGIFSQNRPEWTISELACYTYSLVSVPLYDTLGTEAISYIIDKGETLQQQNVLLNYSHPFRSPKGAMLTHGNIVSNYSSFIKLTQVRLRCPLNSSDVHISYLPLAHMFERIVQGVMLVHGARIGFFQGDVRRLSDDLIALRPTVFPVVPRLLNRMYDKVSDRQRS
uniref:long-chain-fatty-acid--CoA ligase n=1 Tax=Xiphophorus couchianus TaxID=32473 RepID=A0A3B5M341_9TELE